VLGVFRTRTRGKKICPKARVRQRLSKIVPWLSATRINAITGMLGFLLICIGVQFAATGIKGFIAT